MAGRATYTDADKARVYVILETNDGNVKRTARDAGVPENTVRRWRNEWETSGPPSTEEVEQAVEDIVDRMVKVQDGALEVLELKIEILKKSPESAKVTELATLFGILNDKITRAQGLATGRVEHVHRLPSPDEIREALQAAHRGALEAAKERQADIIDAEIVEQSLAELPSPR